ncbi:hypothetical protein [Pedobacter frigiditerrae]|uniref:hypothetical protein n=1 Tax=Pedobacter frigiditerrae TaxID=2530452 RepID=UPI0029318CBC|nr:hypothetical protein [Pedobacter frigiditerrae]
MKKLIISMLCLVSLTTMALRVSAQNTERVQASYLLAFGRLPSSGELTYWNGQGQKSVQWLVDNHKGYIKSNQGTIGKEIIVKSYVDALGYRPSQSEINYHAAFNRTYTEMMSNHLVYVKGVPSEYEKVIKRSYQTVFGRQPNAGELSYWKSQGLFSYMILVSCHQDWKNKNSSGQSQKMAIATNAPFLVTATVSQSVMNETKTTFAGLVSPGGGNMVAAGGGNMVAAGGGNMVAAGGGNMVAAGGGNMVAAGGGN